MIPHDQIDNGKLHQKLHKVCCCEKYLCACNMLWYPCRKAVSGHKIRYTDGDFNLDLTYITPRILIHGFPSTGIEHIYRNPRYELRRLLELQHSGHYKVYNFCCEPGRGYDPAVFDGRVERYPFLDHHTPSLKRMVEFADSAYEWILQDKKNVVTMHCKAGKGRAGLMGCILLFRAGHVASALEAMAKYNATRVDDMKGLTVTSQQKYVRFYEELWRTFWNQKGNVGSVLPSQSAKFEIPEEPELVLVKVSLVLGEGAEVAHKQALEKLGALSVKVWEVEDYVPELVGSSKSADEAMSARIKGNFKIKVVAKGIFKDTKLCEFMHNTLFIDLPAGQTSVDFSVSQLDVKKNVLKSLGSKLKLHLEFAAKAASLAPAAARNTVV